MSDRAGFWIRVAATLVDGVLLLALNGGMIAALVALGDPMTGDTRSVEIATALLWTAWLMYTTMEIFSGGTLGKKLFGLCIARIDAPDGWRLFLRWQTKQLPVIALILNSLSHVNGFRLIGGLANLIIAVGCLFAANDDRLAWHDQWSGTAVFHAKALLRRSQARPGEGSWAKVL